jgi:hypothetical protein
MNQGLISFETKLAAQASQSISASDRKLDLCMPLSAFIVTLSNTVSGGDGKAYIITYKSEDKYNYNYSFSCCIRLRVERINNRAVLILSSSNARARVFDT